MELLDLCFSLRLIVSGLYVVLLAPFCLAFSSSVLVRATGKFSLGFFELCFDLGQLTFSVSGSGLEIVLLYEEFEVEASIFVNEPVFGQVVDLITMSLGVSLPILRVPIVGWLRYAVFLGV